MDTIPARYRVKCELGDHMIDTRSDGVYQWTAGWVKQRAGGGGHAVSCPERENKFACAYHVERKAKGFEHQAKFF